MSPRKKPTSGISAAELMARLNSDEAYQRKKKSAEAERLACVQELHRAEQPIVADLRSVGVDVDSVWDLVNTSAPYPNALNVLLKHLERGSYPDRVLESLGRAMAVGPAYFAWERLRQLYAGAQGSGEREGLAVALAASATPDRFDDLIALLNDTSRGDSRIHLLRAVKRVGGKQGLDLLASFRSDPTLGPEANALLSEER